MTNNNEKYLALTGKWLTDKIWVARGLWPNEGTPVSVEFDANQVISREVQHKDVIGFYHTHPNMPAFPSGTDVKTMSTWVDCLGKPLLCLIDGEEGVRDYLWNKDGKVICMGKTLRHKNIFAGIVGKFQYPFIKGVEDHA